MTWPEIKSQRDAVDAKIVELEKSKPPLPFKHLTVGRCLRMTDAGGLTLTERFAGETKTVFDLDATTTAELAAFIRDYLPEVES